MTTSTFTNAAAARTPASSTNVVRAFIAAWFQATPVYLVYRALTTR